MNALIQLPTAYISVGALFLVMPLATWIALATERQAAIRVWCSGGILFGVGMLLLGMRALVPEWASYPLGNALVWFSTMMMVKALRQELGLVTRWWLMCAVTLFATAVFEYLRLVLNNALLRFSWSILVVLFLLSWISWLAFRIRHTENCKSAYWLSGTYALASAGLVFRLIRTWLGQTNPNFIDANWDGIITSISSLLVAIFGNMGYIGIYLSRSHARETAAVVEKERQEIQAQLGAQIAHLDRQRSLAEMSAALAHELGQPLTAAKIDCHVANLEMARWPSAPAQLKETLRSLGESISRSSLIVTKIHDFIRQREPVLEPVQWSDVYADVKALIPVKDHPPQSKLSWQSFDRDLLVRADRVQLSQVLLNLLRNAFQAARKEVPIEVIVSQRLLGDEVELCVRDNGCGMNVERLGRISGAFFTTKPDGMGVGLAISRTIVQQHGGQMLIESHLDKGTEVRVLLPYCRQRGE